MDEIDRSQPPDAEVLQPWAWKKRRGPLVLGCAVMVLTGSLGARFILKSHEARERTEIVNRMKQIGLALQEFDSQYGCFPDQSTAAAVKEATGTTLTLGSGSSNQLFRQLLVMGSVRDEKLFHVKAADSKEPDNRFDDDAHALAPGECSFAYVADLTSSADPGTPLLIYGLLPGSTTFDSTLSGAASILRIGNSVTAVQIDASGHGRVNGIDLFDPAQPFWHGKAPDLKWPEL
jgi:hypothetical protein